MERWSRSVFKIRRYQHQKPNLKDIIEFAEGEAIIMIDPLFSRETLREFSINPERHIRQRNTNSYVVNSEDGTDEKSERTSQGEKKLENCQLCNIHHDLDECKAINDMVVAERSKFLAKQKLCYGWYENISAKYTARNCPKRRT